MKKGLFCIAFIMILTVALFNVSYGEETAGAYCDVDALTFDENGNPTHDENGVELIAGVKFANGYAYLRSDYSAVCVGIEVVEHYSFFEEFYPLVRSLYVHDASFIDGAFLNKMTELEALTLTNTAEIIDFGQVRSMDYELIFEGDIKADILMVSLNLDIKNTVLESAWSGYGRVITDLSADGDYDAYIYEDKEAYNGFFNLEGSTYYAFEDGRINFDNEVRIDGLLYRFNENGVLTEGPIYDKIAVKKSVLDSKERGWVEFMGKTYYVSLVSGEFNEKPCLKIGGVVRYFNDDFSVKEGLVTEDDGVTKRYYVKGEYKIGWIDVDADGVKESYFLSANGVMVTQSRKIGGRFYDYTDGVLVLRQGLFEENGDFYYYKDGVKASGFIEDNGKTYYFLSESKKMITAESYTIRGYKRQFNSDHSIRPITGWQTKAGVTYYFENGECVTGFKKIDGYTYYFKKSDDAYGAMASGWTSIGGDVYYFYRYGTEKYGRMVTGRQTIASRVYYFNSDGTINSGFVGDSDGNVHYYHYSEMLKGWYKIDGNTYYFTKEQGNMITGEKAIGGVRYTFTSKGVLLGPEYEGATVIGSSSTSSGSGFDISDGDWSDIIIF